MFKIFNPSISFVFRPDNLRFEIQEEDEQIILLLRRHIITNLGWVILVLVLGLVPLLAPRVFSFDFMPPTFRLMIVVCWYLVTFAFAFVKFLLWFFNVHIITDERIIDVNFPSFLYKDISETKIDKIQDVSSKTGGFIRSLLNYGDVFIQTAGTIPEISFEAVPYPDRVAKILNEAILKEEQEPLKRRIK